MWWVSSPYSLSAGPRPHRMRITVKHLADHSRALANVRPGTRVVAEGPYGPVTAAVRRRRKVLLVGGGRGTAPVAALPPATESPSPTTSTTGPSGSTDTGPTPTPSPAPAPSTGTQTVTGSAAQTRYGPVQVQITVTNGKITAVDAVDYPTESPRD